MNDNPGVEIVDLVNGSFQNSMTMVQTLFGIDPNSEDARDRTADFMPLVLAARTLTPDAQSELVVPLITKMCEDLDLDPVNSADDAIIATEWIDAFAAAVQDVTQILMMQQRQAMEMQRENMAKAAALANGQGNLLAGG